MSEDEEIQQEASLDLYEAQLYQVEQAIQAAGESADLVQLKSDLKELISLTKDSLLQLKKARLLQSLGENDTESSDIETAHFKPSGLDDEYGAFQAALSGDVQSSSKDPSSVPSTSYTSPSLQQPTSDDISLNDNNLRGRDEEDDSSDEAVDDSCFSHLVGTKCQAPFSSDWGGHCYGNAMIWSVESLSETEDSGSHKVRVIFINPTHPSIVPCQYYLDGKCRFSDECRRSHGHPVFVSELKAYEEPDHSKICEGCRCLAKFTDDVWYPATVTDVVDDHLVNVRFDAQKQEHTAQVEHIVPLNDDSDSSSDDSDEGAGPSSLHDINEEDSSLPVCLWKPSQTTEKLGAWEVHTKGIGSKLMAKMGYIAGQGLGPQGDGRAEPVPILLLPQGKSLDKIMELKEMSGNSDLFNAMKKLEKRQKLLEKKAVDKEQKKESWGVFGFINNKLGDKKGDTHKSDRSRHGRKANDVTQQDLTKRSDKEVNIQIFKTAEEMRAVERHIEHLKKQLARNETRDRKMAEKVKEALGEQEQYLHQLQTSSQTLETHKERRSAHKKLSLF